MSPLRALLVTSWVLGTGCALQTEPPGPKPGLAPTATTQSPLAADGTETYVWTRRGEELLRRLEPALADEPSRNRALLYGGWTTDGVLADTWEWDGIGWIRKVPAQNPGPRFSAASTFDTAQSRTLLFGGLGATAPRLELAPAGLWEWNGANWARVITHTTPGPRVGASLVWDDETHRGWMFGGGIDITRSAAGEFSVPSDELWTFDGTDWTQIPKAGAWPAARSSSGAVWDRARGRMVVHGGYVSLGIAAGFLSTDLATYQNDTWDWDGTTWTQWANGAVAGEQGAPALGFDAAANTVTLAVELPFGTTTTAALYRGDGTSWTAGPTRPAVDVGYDPESPNDPAQNGALAFAKSVWSTPNGGFLSTSGLDFVAGTPTGALYQHDWVATWDGGFTRFDSTLMPDPLGSTGTATLGTDVFVFGGLEKQDATHTFLRWDGGRWSTVPGGDAVPARRDPGMAALGTDRLVVFGGRIGSARLGDTWIWTRTAPQTGTWQNVTPANGGPQARYGMLYVSLGDRIVMFGGDSAAGKALDDTWVFDGTTWTELHPAQSPPARRTTSAARADDGTVRMFGGGIDGAPPTNILQDLWTLAIDGTTATWTELVAQAGTRRRRAGMATEPTRGRTMLYGGTGDDARSELFDFTAAPGLPYTGIVREQNQDRPRRRYFPTFAANPASGGFVSFGGFSSDSDDILADTWQLEQLGASCTNSAECGYGRSCTEGVCCESSACGPCNTCAAPGSRGVCVARGAYGPQPGCSDAGHVCSADGHCRLQDQERCAENDACASGTCLNGSAGAGVCCTAAGCAVRCVEGSNDLQTPDGTKISCGAYGCSADTCRSTCTTLDDCASNAVCNEKHECVQQSADDAQSDSGCSCRAAAPAPFGKGLAALGLLILALVARRR